MISRSKARGWKRHLDGWQAGVLVLVIAGSAILLAVPRAVAPDVVPPPQIDWNALAATEAEDDRLALSAQDEQLDVDVRAVGSEFRRYNVGIANRAEEAFVNTRYNVAGAARRALKLGAKGLRALRAYQMHRFLEELEKWETTGKVSTELVELGGDFIATVERNAWCTPDERKLVMTERVRRVLFKKRWNDVAGLRGEEFDLTLDEDRVRFSFLIDYPFRKHINVVREGTIVAPDPLIEGRRLRVAIKLSRRDPDYPLDLALGVIHYQSGSFARSAAAFQRFLGASQDGPYTLRTQNYLKAALDKSAETGGI